MKWAAETTGLCGFLAKPGIHIDVLIIEAKSFTS
jgi:hypothetical protein